MAENTFYATSCTNSTYNGLLNGGEDSWSRSSGISTSTYDLGYFIYNMSSIRSTIPSVATIHSVEFHMDIKQSRSATSLYHTQLKSQLFVGSTAKSSENTSPDVGNSWEQKAYGNTVAITSSELHSQDLRVRYQATYRGTLGVTQYGRSLLCKILWDPINTTALSINKTSTTLNKGGSETLTVTRTPSAVSYPTISWTSSNTGVATVDGNGKVTAVANGTATITAKTTDGTNISKTCTVTVRTPVTGVTVSPTSLNLNAGDTYTLTKSIAPSTASNQNVSWTSSNTNVATVDSSGKVTAKGNGTATITCASSENANLKGTCSVTVTTAVTGVTVSPTTLSLNIGGTYTLSHTISPSTASNKNVAWSTSTTAIATVDSNGKVTAVAKGTCTITCTSSANSNLKATCEVTVLQQATGIAIVPSSKQILLGTTKPNLLDFSKWYSNSFSAANAHLSKNAHGLTLTSTANDSYTNTYHMSTNPTTSNIATVDNFGFAVTAGKNYTFSADVLQNSANNSEIFVFWYNSSKAYISHNAATLAGSGTLVLTKQAPSGAAYACIRVDNNVAGYTNLYTNIRVQEEDSDVSAIGQCSVYAKVLPYNVSNENYVLSSSNTNIASVSNNGTIIAHKAGTVTITSTSDDGKYTATSIITVKSGNFYNIKNGSITISKIKNGSTDIKKVYKGSVLLFSIN